MPLPIWLSSTPPPPTSTSLCHAHSSPPTPCRQTRSGPGWMCATWRRPTYRRSSCRRPEADAFSSFKETTVTSRSLIFWGRRSFKSRTGCLLGSPARVWVASSCMKLTTPSPKRVWVSNTTTPNRLSLTRRVPPWCWRKVPRTLVTEGMEDIQYAILYIICTY